MSVTGNAGPVNVVVEASVVETLSRRIIAQDRISSTRQPSSGSTQNRAAALALAAQDVANTVAEFVAAKAVRPTADR